MLKRRPLVKYLLSERPENLLALAVSVHPPGT